MALKYHRGESHDVSTSQSCSYLLVWGRVRFFVVGLGGFLLVFDFMQVKNCLYHHDWHSNESKYNLST